MEETPNLKRLNIDPSQLPTNEEILRRLIRLIVGVILVGQDALRDRLPEWEKAAAEYLATKEESARSAGISTSGQAAGASPPAWFPKEWEYRLVGLAFASPRYLRAGLGRLWSAPRTIWRMAAPLRLPLDLLGVTDYTQNWLEDFVERLHADMEELEQVGKSEAEPSRALGLAVVNEVFDEVIAVMSDAPELRELVATQTAGISTEVIGEVRERAVSSDTLIEALVRKMIKRQQSPPEEMLISPPEDQRKKEW